MTKPEQDRYDLVTRLLHWGMAAAILLLWGTGHVIDALPKGPLRVGVIVNHKSIGLAMLVLVLGRLAWRLTRRYRLRDILAPLQRRLALAGHAALYALMVAQPLSGIAMSQAGGHEVSLFGVLALPALIAKDAALQALFKAAHGLLGWGLALVVVGHVAAALYHRFVRRDAILDRMLFGRSCS
jgi:cytochrome b561